MHKPFNLYKRQTKKKRNVTFHSWRHQFNTYRRGKVADAKLQQLTGHRTLRMVDNYTHFFCRISVM